ncbi:hypothetical protein SARC_10591 [Sphaeroforma arctica JP610]|uniref:Zn(2)-C6 fungal-type domain-containing protein n=1 Tax=Sphaeroforma arctica JP610 TaxID=667725 RepID=A0A0L0FJG6_9EUKA|nr:hypothetical protein SARC_10591 [Sphaeroforma arctica JP610]KNC76934.1 hypothetical protein SARC_10591 [Sphaeroforma arctica JP610]|eukprot:XP_014150836.1 hypothetical protein SARC_10591 [Sphaeroforma arctica JP610]
MVGTEVKRPVSLTMNGSAKRRPLKACIPCRGMKRKCDIPEGETRCTRCIGKDLPCVSAPNRVANKRTDFAYGRSCTRCYQLKRSCSASDTSVYPCALCSRQNAKCEQRQTKHCKKTRTKDSKEANLVETRLSLAMNASYESLKGMDPDTLPEAFGLDYGSSSTWALLYFPRDISPLSVEFLYQARVVNCRLRDSNFTKKFCDTIVGQTLIELNTKTEAQYQQLLPHMKGKPGPPRRTQMLELTQIIDNKICSVVLTHLHDHTGVARLQFARLFVLDLNYLKIDEALTALPFETTLMTHSSMSSNASSCASEYNQQERVANSISSMGYPSVQTRGMLSQTFSTDSGIHGCSDTAIGANNRILPTTSNVQPGVIPPGVQMDAWLDMLESNLGNENWFPTVDLIALARQDQNIYHQLPDVIPSIDYNSTFLG